MLRQPEWHKKPLVVNYLSPTQHEHNRKLRLPLKRGCRFHERTPGKPLSARSETDPAG